MEYTKNLLTETSNAHTIDDESKKMEPGLKKLLDRQAALRKQKALVEQELGAIEKALEIMQFASDDPGGYAELEKRYTSMRPFAGARSLADVCLILLSDCESLGLFETSVWIDKSEAEHLLNVGGFQFGKGNPTNSIEVTLRRLAAQGKCLVQKRGGPHSSRYTGKGAQRHDDVTEEGQGATGKKGTGER